MSVILAVSMLISCMTVGLIATDAAKVTGDEELGATYYIWKSESGGNTASNYTCIGTSPHTFSATYGKNYYIAISTSATDISMGTVWLTGADVSGLSTSDVDTQGFDGKQAVRFALESAATVKVSYSSGSKIKLEAGTSTSECTTDHKMIVTGDQQLTNTTNWQNTWSGAGTRNQMTYNSAVGKYEIKYTNIDASASSSDYFRFRILDLTEKGDPDTSWETDKGYAQGSGAITDASNILQGTSKTIAGADNTFKFSLSAKANITIYLDDSKLSTNSAIEVIVTPAVSTVTAGSAKVDGVVTAAAGTITVTNGTNVSYGGTVNLSATAGDDYVFSQWETNANLTYANNKSATTTATVTGSTTVNAIFVKKSYMLTRGTGEGYTITAPTTASSSKQWGTSVDITANADDMHYIDYLYYKVNGEGDEVKIGSNAGSNATTLTRTLSMPKSNVTVYAQVHERASNTITYGYCTGSEGLGYINVGKQHNTSTSQIEYSIESGSKVLEGTKVLFGARPIAGKKFVGWYDNQAGTGTALSTSQDYVPATASGNYYAKFADAPDTITTTPDPVYSSTKYRLVFKASDYDNKGYYIYTYDGLNQGNWPGKAVTALSYATNGNSEKYYYVEADNKFKYIMNNGKGTQTGNLDYNTIGTKTVSYSGSTTASTGTYTKVDVTTTTPDPDKATTTYYPVKLNITNPDKGVAASTYLSNYFCERSSSVNVYAKPSDTANMKTSIKKVSGSSDTTSVIKWTAASSSMTMNGSATSATATVTFIPKDYYTVNFSAGPNGSVKATLGSATGTEITSGTKVQEDTKVYFTATPNAGYSFSKWTGDNTSTSSPINITVSKNTNVKGWFKNSDKGTAINTTDYYFVYSTSNNYQTWENKKTLYHKGGRVYAYFDTCTVGTAYYFSLSSAAKPKDAFNGNNLAAGLYGWNNSNYTAVTDFTQYITAEQQNWKVKWDYHDSQGDLERGTVYYGKATPKQGTTGFMVDVGEWKNGALEANEKLRVIPIYDSDVTNVDIYAKDGSYRGDDTYDFFPGIADTELTGATNIKHQSEFDTGYATRGTTITVTTTITTNKDKFYVRGFSFNGVTPELYEANTSTGVYTCSYKIPDDFEYDYLEITPIYYRVNDTSAVQFYIENYDKALEAKGWGNTLSVYPYYQDASGNYASYKKNAFGGYPGQPVINYGGRRFIEIPTSYTSGSTTYNIKGVTLSNDYWDVVHREYAWAVSEHLQTYDYDDFYKIFKETSDGLEVNRRNTKADQITFVFKYRETTNNFNDSSNTVAYNNTGKTVKAPYTSFSTTEKDSKFKNGWEELLDYHNRPIDIFGKQLTSAQQTKEPLLIVSDDYAINYVGRYATTWTVYRKNGSNYQKIAEIAPSALIVTNKDRLSDGTYPVVSDEDGKPDTVGKTLPDYADEYEALLAYKETPALITYESAIQNNSSYAKFWNMTNGKSEIATRNDGRWLYSYEGEEINADLRIDYTNEYTGDTTVWTTDTYKGDSNTGTVTGATVHFTNTAGDDEGGNYELTPYHDTADYDGTIYSDFNHYYKFAATEGSGYIFQGWYMERDGIQTAVNADDIKKLTGQSQMTSNATFVARYVKNPAGHLTINHTMADGSTGTGTTYIGVEKSNDGTNWTWITDGTDHFVRADMFSVTDTNVMSYNSGYTLRVTLKTVVESDTSFDRFSANDDAHSPNYFSSAVDTSGNTSTTSFEVPVDDLFAVVDGFPKQQFDTLTYFSHTTKRPELTINHNIDPTSDSTAEGDTYVKVEVLTASGTTVKATYGGDEADGYAKGVDLVVPSQYFNDTDDYRIKVYLKTVMKGFTQFDHFSILGNVITNAPGPHGETVELTSSTDQRTKFATCTFSAKECYNRREFVLPYLSRLIVPDYKYEIKYTYPAYVKTYGNQSYTAKGSFAPEDLTEYMTLNNGDLAFQNDTKKLSFICKKAPYEDNFQKKLDFSKNSTITGRGYSSSDYTMQLNISVTAENEQLSAYFDFPYATTQSNEFIPVVNDGKVMKADTNRQGKTDIYGRDWFVTNDVRHEGIAGKPEFVKAPLIIYDGNKPMYFQYWRVETEATDYNASREYTRCYDYEFNLAIFQNCVITPKYDEVPFATRGMPSPPTSYNDYGRFDPDVNRTRYEVDGNGVSITFIENSRNQYNNGDSGTGVPNSRTGAADRIYSDFLLTFDNNPKEQLNKLDAGQKQAGLIIQPVAYLEKVNGEYVVNDDTHYSSTAGYGGLTPDQVKARILEGNFTGLAKSQFDVHRDPSDVNTGLDNKNRIQYYYGMNNATPKKFTDPADEDDIIRVGDMNNNHAIVYKAFAYIGDGNGTGNLTNVIVGSQPVYFTIYNDAMIQPGYYMPNTSGN